MIVENLIDLFFNVLSGLFSGFQFIGLPLDLISTLETILSYGVWIVGADIMALFVASVVFWWGVQMSIGLAVWVWEHLPLT